MNKFFVSFGKPLFILTILVVLTFQGYWIRVNYENKKREILERTQSEATQILLMNLFKEPALKQKIEKANKSKTKKVEVFVSEPKVEVVKQYLKVSNTGLLYQHEKLDSFLYTSVRKRLKAFLKKEAEIQVYFEGKNVKRTYPKGIVITDQNTTKTINSFVQENNKYRIHIVNMAGVVIYEIKEIIFFSLFYVFLFLITIFILFRSLIFNRNLLQNKEIFTRNMTHELKIPISTILIATEALETSTVEEEPANVKKYAAAIHRAADQLSLLVDSILQHARSSNSKEQLTLSSVNLLSLVKEAGEDLAHIVLKKKAEIVFEDVDKNLQIKGSRIQLKQIFLNLFDNALKYSERDPRIIISAGKMNNTVTIRIQDNGIGIPEKYREEIFAPYFKIMNDDTHNVKGFGLGLSFVRESLKKQGGSIKVLKQKTEGTLIEIKIPAYE
ncbi:sensor histidine kinase [Flavobacterium lipolyticum]|uniref:histidine kinase n=1 Tax=Flavobacterium lipolyticum TaxID=2893754 RepID=A0ABS8M369_9FLAO|nr:HAMP domain-containing sensor histidine kinase [Flavobacterium sp. F-126]MCC9019177.1 HAMP domain-containing histidine kinase [Flavobacterium sp. F-126]